MSIKVKQIQSVDTIAWDAYVHAHPDATLYHLSSWKTVIEKTYGHKTYYLIAIDSSKLKAQSSKNNSKTNYQLPAISNELNIAGILPLVHLKHFLFGNSLISIPFFDIGGILADNQGTEKALLLEAIKLAQDLNVNNIELRHIQPLFCLNNQQPETRNQKRATRNWVAQTRSHKVRMLLDLPESSEVLMKSFKSKLRSQIKKPVKEGLKAKNRSLFYAIGLTMAFGVFQELAQSFVRGRFVSLADIGLNTIGIALAVLYIHKYQSA